MPQQNTTNNLLTTKRKEMGYSIKELASKIGCANSTTSAYFTGFVNPSDETVAVICNYLDMDYTEARKEFNRIFKAWGKAHADRYEKVGNTTYRIKKSQDTDVDFSNDEMDLSQFNVPADLEVTEPEYTTDSDMYDVDKYLEFLYKHISYDDFTALCAPGTTAEDILRYLYGILDYTLYKELMHLC